MWIRSQNREVLVYADKLYISKENDKYTINFDTCDGSWYCLGTYKSKERAIEVLDEIQKKISFFEFGRCRRLLSHQDVIFEMPKE